MEHQHSELAVVEVVVIMEPLDQVELEDQEVVVQDRIHMVELDLMEQ